MNKKIADLIAKLKASQKVLSIKIKSTINDPIEMTRLRKQILQQGVLAIVFTALAIVILGVWVHELLSRYDMVEVLAVNKDIQTPWKLTAADLKTVRLPKETAPANSYSPSDANLIVGNSLINNFSTNEVITRNSFLPDVPSGIIGLSIELDRKGMAVPTSWLSGSYPSLKKGDTLTFMGVLIDPLTAPKVDILAQRVEVMEVIAGSEKQPTTLLLKVNESLAKQLLTFHSIRTAQLHALVDGYKPPLGNDQDTPVDVSVNTDPVSNVNPQ